MDLGNTICSRHFKKIKAGRLCRITRTYVENGILSIEQNKDYCILVGELFVPIGKRGTMLTVRAGDDFGTIDSQSFNREYYELHLNWPFIEKNPSCIMVERVLV